jgi:hypothetical protein
VSPSLFPLESRTFLLSVFAPKRPISFPADQGGLVVTRGGAKPFTFASDDRSGLISIATTLRSGSRFKRALADLRPSDRVFAAEAIGTLPAIDPAESQVLVAQGIGITPFLSGYDGLFWDLVSI